MGGMSAGMCNKHERDKKVVFKPQITDVFGEIIFTRTSKLYN